MGCLKLDKEFYSREGTCPLRHLPPAYIPVILTITHSGLRTDDVLAVDKSGASYFYLKDHLGTVNDIISSAGNLVQHYVYSPFGKIVRIENAAGADITTTPMVENFYTFTGREFDKESGLHYYRARYYDPEVGRFLTVDPDCIGPRKNESLGHLKVRGQINIENTDRLIWSTSSIT